MAIEKKIGEPRKSRITLGDVTPTAALAEVTRAPVEMVQFTARIPKEIDTMIRTAMVLESEKMNWRFIERVVRDYVSRNHPALLGKDRT